MTDKDGLALIPITNKSITEFYPRARDSGRHLQLAAGSDLDTVAVKAVLISFDFRRKDCDDVGQVRARRSGPDRPGSSQNGHPKWKAVDLNYPAEGLGAVRLRRKYLGKAAAPASTTTAKQPGLNPVFDAIKGVLDE